MTGSHLSSLKFDDLALAEPVARGVAEAGFSHCTPIQADTLPIALRARLSGLHLDYDRLARRGSW